MKNLKWKFVLLMAFAVIWICNTSFLVNYTNPDSLLKKARSFYGTNAASGIKFSKLAYQQAGLQNNSTVQIKSLVMIAQFYLSIRNDDSVKYYAQSSIDLATKYHIDSLNGAPFLLLGIANYDQGRYQQAIEKCNRSAFYYKQQKDLPGLAIAYLNIAINLRQLSQYEQAIKYNLFGAEIFESQKDSNNLAGTYNSIASCFVELGDYPKALLYNKKALAIRQKLNDKQSISQSLNNIGFVFKQNKQLDSAIYYLSRCLEMRRHESDSSVLIFTLQNLGGAWRMKGNPKRAESFVLRSLRIAEQYKMKDKLARGYSDLAEVYIAQKKFDQALSAINITQNTAEQMKMPALLMEAYGIKYDLYNQKADYKQALYYSNKKNALNDSLFTVKKDQTIQELDVKYQTNQKEKDIANLHKQNALEKKVVAQQKLSITVLVIAAFLLFLLFVIAYNSFRVKNKANLRIQNLMKELHHRVKNNLQILSALFAMQIENLSDETTKNALKENEARLTSMNLIHNKLYLDNTTTKIEMGEYLTKLLNHIKDSFGGAKQNEINLRIEIDHVMFEADKAVAIGLLVNELATNAFKYAFTDKGGEIYLGLQLVEKSKLLLTLSDNGQGLKEDNTEKAPSFGLRLVNIMARQLNSTLTVKNDNGLCYQLELKF